MSFGKVTPQVYQYVDYVPQTDVKKEPLTETTVDKINHVVSGIFDKILSFFGYFYNCLAEPEDRAKNFFNGQHLSNAVNRGKISDKEIYKDFTEHPLKLSDKGRSFFRDPDGKTTLMPVMRDRGKCLGAVSYFLSEHLNGQNIRTLAASVEEGVPLSAVITQSLLSTEMLARIVDGTPFANAMFVVSQEVDRSFESLQKIIFADKDYTDHQMHILKAVHDYSIEKKDVIFDSSQRESVRGLIAFVKEQLASQWGEELSAEEWIDLNQVAHKIENNKEKSKLYFKNACLKLSGLEIEKYVMGPENILWSLSNLEPGCYNLVVPFFNCLGVLTATHAIALIVEKGGFSYLYDPNIGTGWMSPWNNERTETVERLFKRYTGFSSIDTTLFDRIMNRLLNPFGPLYNETDPSLFALYKVRKIR